MISRWRALRLLWGWGWWCRRGTCTCTDKSIDAQETYWKTGGCWTMAVLWHIITLQLFLLDMQARKQSNIDTVTCQFDNQVYRNGFKMFEGVRFKQQVTYQQIAADLRRDVDVLDESTELAVAATADLLWVMSTTKHHSPSSQTSQCICSWHLYHLCNAVRVNKCQPLVLFCITASANV